MDADSNSWGSDADQGEDYPSDYSEGEGQQGNRVNLMPGEVRMIAKGNKATARKMVNRGRWTKEEVNHIFSFVFIILLPFSIVAHTTVIFL